MPKSRWYGSINNRLLEQDDRSAIVPAVGMPATITMYTDRRPATVTKVINKVRIEITRNEVKKYDEGGYGIEFGGLEGQPELCTRTKRGWQLKGGGGGVLLGTRQAYYDRSF